MRVDLHTHSSPASGCSQISHSQYVRRCVELGLDAIALTNHGSIADDLPLAEQLAAEGILLLHGVEISTVFGDFLVFSPDLEYLDTLRPLQDPLRADDIPEHAAVVWAHPAAGGGISASTYYPGLEQIAAKAVHAIEVYNGNWLRSTYVRQAQEIADVLGLPRTGGSDAHVVDAIGRCATDILAAPAVVSHPPHRETLLGHREQVGSPQESNSDRDKTVLRSTADLVSALREGRVSPWCAEEPPRERRRGWLRR